MKKNLLLLSATLLTLFLLLELIWRLLGYHGINLNYEPCQYSRQFGWELKKNYRQQWDSLEWSVLYETNSEGFRDTEHVIQKNKNQTRVLILGDSLTEGWGVSFKDMWQSILQKNLGVEFEIMTMGTRGYDLIQYYKRLLLSGLSYKPNLVILVLLPNDYVHLNIHDEPRRPAYKIENDSIVFDDNDDNSDKIIPPPVSRNSAVRTLKSILYRSAFLAWLRTTINILTHQPGLEPSIVKTAPWFAYYKNYKKAAPIIFEEFSRLQEKKGFKMIVVYEGKNIPGDLKKMVTLSTQHLILIDLNKSQRWRYDPHPNKAGHQAIADQILKYLTNSNLITLSTAQT